MKIIRKTILDIDIDTVLASDELSGIVDKIQAQAKKDVAALSVEKNSFPLRPSSALKSDRDLHYALLNYFKPGTIPMTEIEGRNCMLLALGHAIEAHLVSFIEKAYEVPFKAQKVNFGQLRTILASKSNPSLSAENTYELNGELDFVIKLPSGELVLGDSKSSADFPFKKADFLKDEHVAQLNLYLHSNFCRTNKITRAWVWYSNKNDSNLKIAEFSYDKRLAEATIARFQHIVDNVVAGGPPPPRKYVLGVDWQSAYSAFRDYEWREFSPTAPHATIGPVSDAQFPKDYKERLAYLVRTYGNAHVTTDKGRTMQAVLQGPTLVIKETSSDGFSY